MHQAQVFNGLDFSSAPLPASKGEFAGWSKDDCYHAVSMLMAVKANFVAENYQYSWICLELSNCYPHSTLVEKIQSIIHNRLGRFNRASSWLGANWQQGLPAGLFCFFSVPNVDFLPYRIMWLDSMIAELNAEVAK